MFPWIFSNLPQIIGAGLAGLRAAAQGKPVVAAIDELGGDDHDAVVSADARVGTARLPTSEEVSLNVDRSRRLAPGQYINERTKKEAVGLHFTAGANADSAIRTFAQDPRRVATAYVVDTDGRIFELFDPHLWAYSFGVKGGAASVIEKRTVAIEIANWGPLRRSGDQLYCWPPADKQGRETYSRRYCRIDETDRFVTATYRGTRYFAAYPEAQIVAVHRLVAHLCREFDIPAVVPSPEMRGTADVAFFARWRGVFGHQNVRADKVDPGPALDWDRLARAIAGQS